MVRAHNKINTTFQDDPTGHGTRREKEKLTKKRWENNISEWTGLGLGERLRTERNGEKWLPDHP